MRPGGVVVLSDGSIVRPWVEREVEQALEEEQRRGRKSCSQSGSTILSWASRVAAPQTRKRRFVGDFSGWKDHDAYQIAFERLLRDLNEAAATPAADK